MGSVCGVSGAADTGVRKAAAATSAAAKVIFVSMVLLLDRCEVVTNQDRQVA